jgi:hypothetical protein
MSSAASPSPSTNSQGRCRGGCWVLANMGTHSWNK